MIRTCFMVAGLSAALAAAPLMAQPDRPSPATVKIVKQSASNAEKKINNSASLKQKIFYAIAAGDAPGVKKILISSGFQEAGSYAVTIGKSAPTILRKSGPVHAYARQCRLKIMVQVNWEPPFIHITVWTACINVKG